MTVENILFCLLIIGLGFFSGQIEVYLIYLGVYSMCWGTCFCLHHLLIERKQSLLAVALVVLFCASTAFAWWCTTDPVGIELRLEASVVSAFVWTLLTASCVWLGQTLAIKFDRPWIGYTGVSLGALILSCALGVVFINDNLGSIGV